MLLVFGHPASQVLPLWEIMNIKAIMLNAYQLKSRPRVYEKLKEHGIRKVFNVPDDVQIWMDSGGYQALRRGVKLRVEDVVKWYEELKPDFCIALDLPIAPNDPNAKQKVRVNVSNAKYMYDKVPCQMLPVFHPVNDVLFEEYLSGYSFTDFAAVGGLIPRILTVRNASRREGLEFLIKVRKEFSGWLHALGLGSAKMIPVLRELGYDSTDTQTWRHKAAYGKIMLPGRGERHITDRKVNFGKKKINEEELMEVERIATLLGITIEELKNYFIKRAIFNAFVISSI